MKRLLTLLALVLCSCAETFVGEEIARPNNENLPDLTAAFAEAGDTRTYIEDGKYLRWHEDDRLTAFYGNTLNRQYKFNGATGDNSGTFSLVPDGMLGTGNAFDRIYALYPYNADARITDEGVISLALPAVQNYAENSFGRGANTMIAVTENVEDTFLAFKNACGYLKLKLYNAEGATIKSIEVKGNSGERLAGAATATIAFGEAPVLAMADDATTSVTLDCGEGVALGTTAETATEFWFVLPATTFAEGLTITATDTEGKVFKKSTTKEVVIERNAIQPMAVLEAECTPPGPADNEIWYTNGSTTEATAPYFTNAFGANIVSNTYDAAKECWVIKFDGKVTTIGASAFLKCSSLTSVTIPNSATSIGYQAFNACSSLKSATIGNGVISIREQAFSSCSSLTAFYGKFASEDNRCLIVDGALNSFAPVGLTEYTIPDGVTSIGKYAFNYCSSLTSVTIPDSVTLIGIRAFNACSSLASLIIPDGVTSIEEYAFNACSSLTSVAIGDSVTSIGKYAFSYCSNLRNVTIGNSVTSIGKCAFDACTSSTSIHISDLSAWCKIDFEVNTANPLFYAKNLYLNGNLVAELTIPSDITEIKNYAFYGCSSLTRVTIPDSVTSIGDSAFYGCSGLTSITIPDSVTTIGDWAFSGCSRLTSVTIPDSVTKIGNGAFTWCTSLASVTIPDSVTYIGENAFCNCSSLTSATIGNSVNSIGWEAFSYCGSLTSVYCKPTTPPTGNDYMFYNHSSRLKIYVPRNSVSAYKSIYASGWSEYAYYIEGYDFGDDEESGSEITEGTYTVVLNNAWRQSTSVSNPDSSSYDGVYESYSNYNIHNDVATMYIDIDGYSEFSIYVRSNAESTYDYVTVSELDSTTQKMSTSGKQNSGTAISNYTKVTYTGIDGGKHRITVIYKKDSSQHSGTDRGYLIIPKNQ